MEKKTQATENLKEVKTFTQAEVDEMLANKAKEVEQEKTKMRSEVVNAMAQKQTELKSDLMQAGSDDDYSIAKWDVMRRMADDMVKSNALPQGENSFTVMMKMQAGREMGLKPIESIKSFYIVKGVLTIFGAAVTRRLREHGWQINYVDELNKCTITVTKKDITGKIIEQYSDSLTFEDAEKSGWTKSSSGPKPGWLPGANRKLKLRYGAASSLIKTYLPDVLGSAADIKEIAEDTIPLYNNAVVEDSPATDQQKEQIKKLLGYEEKLDEQKANTDEWLDKLTYKDAVAEIKNLVMGDKE